MNRKRAVTLIFVILFVCLIVWIVIEGKKSEVLPRGSRLPKINYKTFRGELFLTTKSKRKKLIIYFSKDCPHCKYELKTLNENIKRLFKTDVFLFTSDKNYLNDTDIKKYEKLISSSNVVFGIVDKEEFYKLFGSITTPSLFFFNGKGNLTSKIIGETKIERILMELKNSDSPEYRDSGYE